jgi:hypothetical protein
MNNATYWQSVLETQQEWDIGYLGPKYPIGTKERNPSESENVPAIVM